MTKILAFAGQGAQYYQMGKELYQSSKTVRFWLEKSDDLVKKRRGSPFLEKMFDPTKTFKDPMDDICLSHPALFSIQYAIAQMVLEKEPIGAVFGFSLGELVAMSVSQILSFEEALSHLLDQADWLARSNLQGRLFALFASQTEIEEALSSYQNCYSYAIHSLPNLCTIATPDPSFEFVLQSKKISYQKLPVPHPFHSPWLDPMIAFFKLQPLSFSSPHLKIASCAQQAYISSIEKEHIWKIVRNPIHLEQTFRSLFQEEDEIFDCSPNGTIKALLRNYYGFHSPIFQRAQTFLSLRGGKSL